MIWKREGIHGQERKRYKCIRYDRLEHQTTKNDDEDQYKPKRSQHVILDKNRSIKPDDDLWVEIQVVRRRKKKRKRTVAQCDTRSLFYCIQTKIAYWDEPPTGASKIILTKDLNRLKRKHYRYHLSPKRNNNKGHDCLRTRSYSI